MSKKIVTITMIIDTDNSKKENWEKVDDYFESEIDNVIDELFSLRTRTKETVRQGITPTGTKYSLIIKR